MFEVIQNPDRNVVSKGSIQLEEGLNTFVLNGVLKPDVELNHSIDCRLQQVVIGGTPFPITAGENAGLQRIGSYNMTLKVSNDRGSPQVENSIGRKGR